MRPITWDRSEGPDPSEKRFYEGIKFFLGRKSSCPLGCRHQFYGHYGTLKSFYMAVLYSYIIRVRVKERIIIVPGQAIG